MRLLRRRFALASLLALTFAVSLVATPAVAADADRRVVLDPSMITNEVDFGDAASLVDEQDFDGNYRDFKPETGWQVASNRIKSEPASAVIDLGQSYHLSRVLVFDTNGTGKLEFFAGEPGDWTPLFVEDGVGYLTWKEHDAVGTQTRYLRVVKHDLAGFHEVLVFEETAEARADRLDREAALEKAAAEKANRPLVDAGEPFGELPLIQEIVAGEESDAGVEFVESAEGVTEVKTILGKPVRVLPSEGEASYFAYRVGALKLLEPGKAYLLTVDFPEDEARSFSIGNRGGDLIRGVQTGMALGDVIFTYTNNNLESLDVPLSGEMRTFRQLFYLHDRFSDLDLPRGHTEPRPSTPDDGFYVIFSVPEGKNAPASAGAAVWRVRLFEAPNPERFNVALNLPPEGLPRRHIFVREEMGDHVVGREVIHGAVDDPVDFWRYKAKIHNFLGMNTFTKDLLEFGSTQHWRTGGNDWSFTSAHEDVWERLLPILDEHGLNVLPYYEYAGSKGRSGLGFERRAQPLKGDGPFTHITWSEKATADLTDPDTLADFKRFIDETILKFKDEAEFLGAWIRPRVSSLPIGFADATRQRFAEEANGGVAVSREELQNDESLRSRYYDWWFQKRRAFLVAIRDYMRQNGIEDAMVLYTSYAGEPGPSIHEPGQGNRMALVTDEVDRWKELLQGHADYERVMPIDFAEYVASGKWTEEVRDWRGTWGDWEWQHADPPPDPQTYTDTDGVLMAYPFNRLFTVSAPEPMEPFRAAGDLAIVRHFALNEHTRHEDLGYYVADYDRAGPYIMLAEARAVANADPRYLGYLAAHNFSRGFPEYVRRFNANYLALPALPSTVVDAASSEPDVVVRRIDAGEHGVYFAVVNTGLEGRTVTITLPDRGRVLDASTGEPMEAEGATLELTLDPAQLQALHVKR